MYMKNLMTEFVVELKNLNVSFYENQAAMHIVSDPTFNEPSDNMVVDIQ